ncbi:MAG: hypothetical protein WCV79_03945 [Candidatus Paceibacterota bacterium]|jgi:hypothetical protein
MKKIRLFLGIAVLTVASLSLVAQNLTMVTSEDALRSYAFEQAAHVAISVSSALPLGNYAYSYSAVQTASAAGVQQAVRNANIIAISMAVPTDTIFIWIGVYDKDGDLLFGGYRNIRLLPTPFGFVLPPDYGTVELTLADNVPIKISGASSAMYSARDQNGNLASQNSLRVSNEKVFFPKQFAAKEILLAVYVSESSPTEKGGAPMTWYYWNVVDGSRRTTVDLAMNFDVKYPDLVIANKGVVEVIKTTNHVGNNLLVELTCEKTTEASFFFAVEDTVIGQFEQFGGGTLWNGEYHLFTGILVRESGSSEWKLFPAMENTAPASWVELEFDAGTYYIIPTWSEGHLVSPPKPPYVPPSYPDGGKG